MERRNFLISALASLGVFLMGKVQAKSKCVYLDPNKVYIAKPSTFFILPAAPADGDTIQLVVDKESLTSPCELQGQMAKIVGEFQPLTLDSLAVFKLRYNALQNDWQIT